MARFDEAVGSRAKEPERQWQARLLRCLPAPPAAGARRDCAGSGGFAAGAGAGDRRARGHIRRGGRGGGGPDVAAAGGGRQVPAGV